MATDHTGTLMHVIGRMLVILAMIMRCGRQLMPMMEGLCFVGMSGRHAGGMGHGAGRLHRAHASVPLESNSRPENNHQQHAQDPHAADYRTGVAGAAIEGIPAALPASGG
jgi:hypothetical protein